MAFTNAYVFPIVLCIGLPISCFITFLIGVYFEHINRLFPYISDTGTLPPEHCIFALILNIGSILLAIIGYVRYRQIRYVCEKHGLSEKVEKLNRMSLYFGSLSSFGIMIVGNFQETNVFLVHIAGAAICFIFGCVYQWIQVVISFHVYPNCGKKLINYFRIVFAIVSVVCLNLTGIFGIISILHRGKVQKDVDLTHIIVKWNHRDVGYAERLVSTVSEWILLVTTMCFVLTFTEEFKQVHFEEPLLIEKKISVTA